jgi:glycosyltransferase involved in cell wall biosynthesis
LETKRLLLFEKSVIEYAKLTLLVNKTETDFYRSYGNAKWLPNGVNKALFDVVEAPKKPIVCFFGAMFYQPNVDAVLWFCKNVLPSVNSDIKFYIIGGRPSNEIIKLQSDRIVVTGFIDNPYDLISSALCTVAPMQTGAGIQNKILESMGLGQITITNNLGSLPIIGSKNSENILIANKPEEFVKLINEIYENPNLYSDLKVNARNLILNNYSWERYGELLFKYAIE